MPSVLTRNVFRRLLANKPITHSGCLRRRAYNAGLAGSFPITPRAAPSHCAATQAQQVRTFFSLDMFRLQDKEAKETKLAPGIEVMMDLVRRQRLRARLPTQEEIAEALDSFVSAKLENVDSYLEDTQAQLVLTSVRYVIRTGTRDAESHEGTAIETDTLIAAADISQRRNPHGHTEDHVELARVLSEELSTRGPEASMIGTLSYCSVLALCGHPAEARKLMVATESQTRAETSESLAAGREVAWLNIMGGFARLNNEAELNDTWNLIQKRGVGRSAEVASTMLCFYIQQNDLRNIKCWWDVYHQSMAQTRSGSPVEVTRAATDAPLIQLVKWCAANQQLEFGHEIVRQLVRENPPKSAWDAIFLWAAATGKGVDEISRMFGVMEEANDTTEEQAEQRHPDITTINHLVEHAMSQKDPYTAERFISMGRERGISPNRRTYVLQIDYRLNVRDFDGALAAYKSLQAEGIDDNSDVPAVNRLVTALCSAKRHDFDSIMNVVADLAERQARFEAETVAALALLHLERHELHDVVDLLNTHAFSFSNAERAYIRNEMVRYCLDDSRQVAESWDCYTILREVFDEIQRDQRTEIMLNFLQHERGDMAVHTFNHMRAHSRPDTMPTIDTYVAAFLGIAKLQDDESLEVLHNQLKLDFNINVDTRLRNTLIIAYTKCRRPRKALQFWDDIVASKEGPNHGSLHIAFRACEQAPFGDLKAQEIWNRLRKMNVDLDSGLWASFAASIAGNGEHAKAMSILDAAESAGEIEVDAFMIGSLFAAVRDSTKQSELEAWATQRYPGVWEKLNQLGVDYDPEYETRSFKIDRSVAP